MKHILAILVVALLFSQSSALAETKEIVAEGTYNMGDGETPTVAESRALLQAKRTAVEEAGTYVESYSKTKNPQQAAATDWQFLANVATTLTLIIAIGTLLWQVVTANRERQYAAFLKFVEAYQELQKTTNQTWLDIRRTVRANPTTAHEIQDSTSTFDYLMQRLAQSEPLLEVERHVLESEIQQLNLLNEICRYAKKDTQKALLAKALFAREIAFYKARLNQIKTLRERVNSYRLLSTPRTDSLESFDVKDFFPT